MRRAGMSTGLMIAALTLAACSDRPSSPAPDDDTTASTPTPTQSPVTEPSRSADPTPTPTVAPEPVTGVAWYVVDSRTGLRLAREQRELPGEDPAVEAVEAMIAGPVDPDYTTTWNPDTDVLSVARSGDDIVVDLSEAARTANVGSEGAAAMVQQLVHTATDAVDRDAGVVLLIEGEPAGELWGAVTWDAPARRAKALDVRLLVQIDTPREGGVSGSPVTVTGQAAAFEATVPWRVLDAAGDEVASGATTARRAMRMSAYSFEVELEPGTYTIEVIEDDPSGGEGGDPMSDSRTFLVE